jgi:hypothetical protein
MDWKPLRMMQRMALLPILRVRGVMELNSSFSAVQYGHPAGARPSEFPGSFAGGSSASLSRAAKRTMRLPQ